MSGLNTVGGNHERRSSDISCLREIGCRHIFGKLYRAYANREKTGDREAYIYALEAAAELASHVARGGRGLDFPPSPQHEECLNWFGGLGQILRDLDSGTVSAVIRSPVQQGKALPTSEWLRRTDLVLAAECLHRMGMRLERAAQTVVEIHHRTGSIKVTESAKDLLSWRKDFKKNRVKNRVAAKRYERLIGKVRCFSEGEIPPREWVIALLFCAKSLAPWFRKDGPFT